MTKVLVITNKSDITSDFIIKQLKETKIPFYRFNTDELTKTVFVSLDFSKEEFLLFDEHLNEHFYLDSFTAVYYRRPELPIIEATDLTEGELSFLENEIIYTLEAIYRILNSAFWVSSVYSIRNAENKPHQLLIAKKIGLKIPASLISNWPETFQDFVANGERIIKPIKSGLIESEGNDSIIFTSLLHDSIVLDEQIRPCPQFVQQHIEKIADVRVTVVGKKVFSAKICSQVMQETKIDWRRGENELVHENIELPNDVCKMLVELVETLDLKFGAIDLIQSTSNEFYFLEINPNGQWAWIERQTGHKISSELVNLLVNEKN